jgi:hypothetical protein
MYHHPTMGKNTNIAGYLWNYQSAQTFFQEKMSKLMASLEFAHTYLDDLLIISTKEEFAIHLEKLEQV